MKKFLPLLLLFSACGQTAPSYDLQSPVPIEHQVVITVDDVPSWQDGELTREEMSALFVEGFQRAPIPGPVGFVLGTLLDSTEHQKIVQDWSAAGAHIGNHTFSHIDLHEVLVSTYQEEIIQTQTLIDQIVGTTTPTYFRHTYLHEGDTLDKLQTFNTWLDTSGYRAVPPTVNFLDYLFEDAYRRCLSRSDSTSITQLEGLFLKGATDHLKQAIEFADQLVGRKVPHIALLHMTPFSARMFRELILAYKGLGVEFVSVEDALEDDIYKEPIELIDLDGMPLLERMLEVQNGPSNNELTMTLFGAVNAICPE